MVQVLAGGAKRWSGVASTAWSTVGLGSVARWGLGDGRVWMDACRMVALSVVVVAPMAERSGKVNALIHPEGGTAKDGGGRF